MALFGLFARSKSKNEVRCKKGRGKTFDIAGEASYQTDLLRIAGGKKKVLYPEVWKFALGWGVEPLLGHAPAGAAHPGIPWSC
jgi:hypothetical protein